MNYRAVFQVNDGTPDGGLKKAVRHIKNTLKEIPDCTIELAIHGRAIRFLRIDQEEQRELVESIQRLGVKVLACTNALAGAGLEKDDIFPSVEIIPSAVAHVVKRQVEGWAYLKVN